MNSCFEVSEQQLEAPLINDEAELKKRGICRCDVGSCVELSGWADELSTVTPLSIFAEDGEYAQYRNIIDREDFPFREVLDSITSILIQNFIDSIDEIRLDDAFAIHYNESHWNTKVSEDMLIALVMNRDACLTHFFKGEKTHRSIRHYCQPLSRSLR